MDALDSIRFKLTIAYDGANYEGWQIQKVGRGVQQLVEEACAKLFPSVRRVHSSSRTDTGVHALGMIAHLDIPRREFRMEPRKLALALNAHLPEDIRIVAAVPCRPDFHARFDATGKQYRYFVWNHFAHNPLLRHQTWQVPHPLDLAAMRAGAAVLIGTHDFESFAATRAYKMESTVRTLTRCAIQKKGPLITFVIEGDGFLYKMCRGIAGTLVQVGQGKFSVTDVQRVLATRDRRVAGMTAPAHGLVLWKVFYGRKPKEQTAEAGTRRGKGTPA
jgi:tRNA pseudouridine38-40 synthase